MAVTIVEQRQCRDQNKSEGLSVPSGTESRAIVCSNFEFRSSVERCVPVGIVHTDRHGM